jgi:lysophosphatidylcholine acyltransferase/lyso-PAF acetyltransferase
VLVDRHSAESRAAARAAIAERAAAADDPDAPPLMIFPEGTTTNGLCLIAWERGAFAPGRAVVPMAIAYPKGQPKPDALFSIETLRAIARPKNRMLVTFLPPFVPDVAEVADATAFAAATRARVARTLDLPCSELTFRVGLHRKRREGPPASVEAVAALRSALPPRPFRDECCACGGAEARVEPRE